MNAKVVFRTDVAHAGANYNHLNINPKISGIKDPHLPIPPGGLVASETVARVSSVLNKANKVKLKMKTFNFFN